MQRSALVIGGTGFLGRAIVEALRAANWAVTCLARGRQPYPLSAVPFLQADRDQGGELGRVTGGRDFDLVVDCAAFQAPHAHDAIAAFAGRCGLYIFISTDFVYAATADAVYPLREDAPKQRDLPYAAGKLDCEAAFLQAWQEQQFPAIVLRPPHIVGAGRALGCDPLVMREANLLNRIRTGEELPLVAEGQLLIQPVWHREIGLCIAHLASQKHGEPGEAQSDEGKSGESAPCGHSFNCTGSQAITTLHYYEIVAEYVGVPLRWRSVSRQDFINQWPEKAHMARHRVYDLTALHDIGGYQSHLGLCDAIYEAARWAEQPERVA